MSEKTGYLMLNREWDLDWRTIVQATKLVDTKQMALEDFRTTVLVYHPEFDWMQIETAAAGGSVKEEEGRRKIVAFKEELTALGKENLFFRWIELVQYESSRGEFGPEQQLKTMQKARDMVSQILPLDCYFECWGRRVSKLSQEPVSLLLSLSRQFQMALGSQKVLNR
jgi:hypothetical protein